MPAYLFERHAPKGCKGECEHPLPIIPVEVGSLTCCHLWASYDLHKSILGLEHGMRLKVEQGRERERCLHVPHGQERPAMSPRGFVRWPPIDTQVQLRLW